VGRNKLRHRHLPPRMRFASNAWFYADSRGGRKPWVLLGHTYADAILRYAQLEAQAANRRDFNALADKYVREGLPKLADGTQAVYRTMLKPLRRVFGHVLPEDIEQVHAYRYMDERGKPVARQEVALLSSVLAFGVGVGWLRSNALRGMKFGKVVRRQRYITDAELAATLEKASPEVAQAIRFMHYTALRVSDALAVRWRDWKPDGLHVRIRKTKTPMVFERTPGLEALMGEMRNRRIGSLHVLAERNGTPWNYKRHVCRVAEGRPRRREPARPAAEAADGPDAGARARVRPGGRGSCRSEADEGV
jgi:integrase